MNKQVDLSPNHLAVLEAHGIDASTARSLGIRTVRTKADLPRSMQAKWGDPLADRAMLAPWPKPSDPQNAGEHAHLILDKDLRESKELADLQADLLQFNRGNLGKYTTTFGASGVTIMGADQQKRFASGEYDDLLVIEGTLKVPAVLAAMSLSPERFERVLVVGIQGINGWSHGGMPSPEFVALFRPGNALRFFILPDADVDTNPRVNRAAIRAVGAARSHGASLGAHTVRMPGVSEKNGIDDYLATLPMSMRANYIADRLEASKGKDGDLKAMPKAEVAAWEKRHAEEKKAERARKAELSREGLRPEGLHVTDRAIVRIRHVEGVTPEGYLSGEMKEVEDVLAPFAAELRDHLTVSTFFDPMDGRAAKPPAHLATLVIRREIDGELAHFDPLPNFDLNAFSAARDSIVYLKERTGSDGLTILDLSVDNNKSFDAVAAIMATLGHTSGVALDSTGPTLVRGELVWVTETGAIRVDGSLDTSIRAKLNSLTGEPTIRGVDVSGLSLAERTADVRAFRSQVQRLEPEELDHPTRGFVTAVFALDGWVTSGNPCGWLGVRADSHTGKTQAFKAVMTYTSGEARNARLINGTAGAINRDAIDINASISILEDWRAPTTSDAERVIQNVNIRARVCHDGAIAARKHLEATGRGGHEMSIVSEAVPGLVLGYEHSFPFGPEVARFGIALDEQYSTMSRGIGWDGVGTLTKDGPYVTRAGAKEVIEEMVADGAAHRVASMVRQAQLRALCELNPETGELAAPRNKAELELAKRRVSRAMGLAMQQIAGEDLASNRFKETPAGADVEQPSERLREVAARLTVGWLLLMNSNEASTFTVEDDAIEFGPTIFASDDADEAAIELNAREVDEAMEGWREMIATSVVRHSEQRVLPCRPTSSASFLEELVGAWFTTRSEENDLVMEWQSRRAFGDVYVINKIAALNLVNGKRIGRSDRQAWTEGAAFESLRKVAVKTTDGRPTHTISASGKYHVAGQCWMVPANAVDKLIGRGKPSAKTEGDGSVVPLKKAS